MKQEKELTKENFSALMLWFSPEPEIAGEKYEEVRNGLIRFFRFRGCNDAETLADDAITRVAMKVTTYKTSTDTETIAICYGFAKNIFREYLASKNWHEIEFDLIKHKLKTQNEKDEGRETTKMKCLESCLNMLDSDDRTLLLKYYLKSGKAKFDLRKKLADDLNVKKGTLHTKIHRLKSDLKKCVNKCINQKNYVSF